MKSRRIYDILYLVVGLPWFFLMLFSSNLYTGIKVSLLAVLIIICLNEKKRRKISYKRRYVKYIFFFITYFLFSLLLGIINGYEFEIIKDSSLIQNYVFAPLCVLILSAVVSVEDYRKEFLWRILLYFTLMMTILDVVKVTSFMFGVNLPFLGFIKIYSEEVSVKLALRVTNESSLMFLLPIFVFLLLNPGDSSKKDKFIYLIITFMGILYTVISGRKILELSLVFVSFFSIIFVKGKFKLSVLFTPRKIGLYVVSVIAILALSFVFDKLSKSSGLDIIDLALEQINRGFSSDADGVEKRFGTTSALINMWLESPLWGNGLNAYAPDYLANETTKWSYEVVYIAMLAQTGIIGMAMFVMPVFYILKRLWKLGRIENDNRYYGLAFGFSIFLFCGSSNPLVYFVWPWSVVLTYVTFRSKPKLLLAYENGNK